MFLGQVVDWLLRPRSITFSLFSTLLAFSIKTGLEYVLINAFCNYLELVIA